MKWIKWHKVKSVQMRIFLVRIRENTDQKKLRIWTLFTQCGLKWMNVEEKPNLLSVDTNKILKNAINMITHYEKNGDLYLHLRCHIWTCPYFLPKIYVKLWCGFSREFENYLNSKSLLEFRSATKNTKQYTLWVRFISGQCFHSISTWNNGRPQILGGIKKKHWSEIG